MKNVSISLRGRAFPSIGSTMNTFSSKERPDPYLCWFWRLSACEALHCLTFVLSKENQDAIFIPDHNEGKL